MGVFLLALQGGGFEYFTLAVDDKRARLWAQFGHEKLAIGQGLYGAGFFLLALVGPGNLFCLAINFCHAAMGEILGAIKREQHVATGEHPAIAGRCAIAPLHLAVLADNHDLVGLAHAEEGMGDGLLVLGKESGGDGRKKQDGGFQRGNMIQSFHKPGLVKGRNPEWAFITSIAWAIAYSIANCTSLKKRSRNLLPDGLWVKTSTMSWFLGSTQAAVPSEPEWASTPFG